MFDLATLGSRTPGWVPGQARAGQGRGRGGPTISAWKRSKRFGEKAELTHALLPPLVCPIGKHRWKRAGDAFFLCLSRRTGTKPPVVLPIPSPFPSSFVVLLPFHLAIPSPSSPVSILFFFYQFISPPHPHHTSTQQDNSEQ